MHKHLVLFSLAVCFFLSCSKPDKKKPEHRVAFLDAFQDETIDRARVGFFDALKSQGFGTAGHPLSIIYKNAEGSASTLNLALSYIQEQEPELIGTSTTLSTVAAIKKEKKIPVFMMVSPDPALDGLLDSSGHAPANLFGVYENLHYIDTSLMIIRQLLPKVKSIGLLYSQGESQSANAFELLKKRCLSLGIRLEALPVNNSSETQLVVQALLHRNIEAFFALPDNSVFASFETILKECNQAEVPIFTSEEGLVKRGAVAAFGADMYQWGYQSGMQAAHYLEKGNREDLKPAIVKIRRRVMNAEVARHYKIQAAAGFVLLSSESQSIKKFSDSVAKPAAQTGFFIQALLPGLGLACLAIGIFLTLKIFNIPDITTDGSYTLGAAITGALLSHGYSFWTALPLSFAAGALAGSITALIATKLRINALLSGILVMFALRSVNLEIMGRSNIPLTDDRTLFSAFPFLPQGAYGVLIVLAFFGFLIWLLVSLLLRTDFGVAMRATGNSETMVRSLGVDTDRMKITGLALANGLIGLSGFLISQYQGFVDINMGIGIVITGLGSVMIGEALLDLLKVTQTTFRVAGVVIGSLIFQLLIAATLSLGVDANMLQLCTSVFVLLIVSISGLRLKLR